MEKFICPICGNTDLRFIGNKMGQPYCRLCLPFNGTKVSNDFVKTDNIKLTLNYSLSQKQQEISDQVKKNILNKKNILIHAVTGAGKTELIYQTFEYFLNKKLNVGFATPRKDVVIDLLPRFQEAFKKAKIVSVYGDHITNLEGDIILLTTHQLYRYENYFDLLVVDEIDAFPYKGNNLLYSFFTKSVKGNYILLSATPSISDIDKIKKDNGIVLSLYERYHKHDLPVPEFVKCSFYSFYYTCLHQLNQFLKSKKPVFIFAPTINIGEKLFSFLSTFVKGGSFVSSKEELRSLNIRKFKDGQLRYLVTTSILERGVTVNDLQVIIFMADHQIFDKASLIQISGRVGRKKTSPSGKVVYIGENYTSAIESSINEIKRVNRIKNNGL